MKIVSLLVVALAVASCPAQNKQKRPRSHLESLPYVLRKAMNNAKDMRYIGRRTVQFNRGDRAINHVEIVTKDGALIRIEFPSDSKFAGQVIVENASERRHYFPEKNEIRVLPPRREEALQRILGPGPRKKNAVYTVVRGDTVCGYATDQVVVSDPAGNIIQRLHIEPRTGALLKRQLFDDFGHQIGAFEFEQVNLNPGPIDPGLFRLERRGAKIISIRDQVKEAAEKGGFAAAFLSKSSGYVLDGGRVMDVAGRKVFAQFYRSSKGSVTLFQVKGKVRADRIRELSKRSLEAYSWEENDKTYVLVGNFSQDELGRLAKQVGVGTW